jgi:hypothetical protein
MKAYIKGKSYKKDSDKKKNELNQQFVFNDVLSAMSF